MELPIYISNIFHPQCQAKQCTDEFAQCLMQTAVRRRRRQLNKWIFFQLMTSNLDPERRASRKKNGQKNSLAWEFLKHIRNLSFTVFVYVLGNSSQPIEFFAVKKRFFGRSLCRRFFLWSRVSFSEQFSHLSQKWWRRRWFKNCTKKSWRIRDLSTFETIFRSK